MKRQYAHPPIVEAICEFRFEPDSQWDLTIPGLVYERMREQFPERRVKHGVQLEVEAEAGEEGIAQRIKGAMPVMQFMTRDRRALVQIGQDILAINHLRPYPTWELYRSMITDTVRSYRQVVDAPRLRRLGLRYINRIDVVASEVLIEDYIRAYPMVPIPEGAGALSGWVQRVEIPYEDDNGSLVVKSGAVGSDGHTGSSFILDLDFGTQKYVPSLDDAFMWLDRAHERIEEMFELTITDKTRELFDMEARPR